MLDSHASGWHASVDNEPAEIVQANGLFRAVHLGPGRHTVTFTYSPVALQWGSVVSVAGLFTIGVLVVIPTRRGDDRAWRRRNRLTGRLIELDGLDAVQPTRRLA